MAKTFWGIDIGSASIKAVQAEVIDGVVFLLDCAVVPILKSDDEDSDLNSSIADSLKMLVEDKGIEGASAAFSISGKNVFTKYFSLPPVDNASELINYEAQQQIPFPLDEVIWDYHIFGINEETFETDVAIFAVKKPIIDDIFSLAKSAKLNVELIQSSAFAVLNFGVIEYGDEKPLVLLEGGSANTDLIISDNGNFWPRSLPISGSSFSKALQSKFQIPEDEAEKLKINLKESGQSDRIFKVLEPTIRELLGEFQRSVGFYRSQRKELNYEDIRLTGNALRIPGLDDFLATGMSKKASYISKPKNIVIAESENESLIELDFGSLTIAIGLAAQGLQKGPVKINFVPKELLLKKYLNKKKPYILGALALFALTLGLGWMQASSLGKEAKSIKRKADSKSKVIATLKSDVAGAKASLASEEKKIKSFDSYLQKRGAKYQKLLKIIDGSAEKDKIWFSEIKTSFLPSKERKGIFRKKGLSVSKKNIHKDIYNSKSPLMLVELKGLAQNLAEKDQGLNILKEFQKKLENFEIEGSKTVLGEVYVTSSEVKEELKPVSKPPLAITLEKIDESDVLGKELWQKTKNRVDSLKDIKRNFFSFDIEFYVDLDILKLPKPKEKESKETKSKDKKTEKLK